MPRTSRFRACPLCEAICGLEFQYEQDTLVAIRGDSADPFSGGHICPKGNAILDLEADPDRVQQPLRRRGKDWEQIGWNDAFDLAGERIAEIQKLHGNDALGVYVGNPNVHHFGHIAYLPPLLRSFRTRNVFSASSVDQWPHQLVCWAMYGHQFLLPIPDLDRTDYFLMLGANPVASNGSLLTAPGIAQRLKKLASRGKLIVIDPRRTETAELANEHLFIRPASDAWFLIALLQALMRIGAPRIGEHADRLNGLDQALRAIAAINIGDLHQRTAIAASSVERIAAELWNAPSAVVYGRIGVSTQKYGSLCQWLMQLINLYSGNLDRAGGALPNHPAIPISGPGTSAGNRDRWRSRVRGLPEFAGELPVAALSEEIVTAGAGQIRALFTCAGNPVLSTPNGRALDAALGSLDFMVSVDIYVNETTRHADLILPPASFLTQDHYDLIFNGFAVRQVARLNTPLRRIHDSERADWQILDAIGAAHARACEKPWQSLAPPRQLIAAGLARGPSGLTLGDLEAAPHGLDLGPLQPSLFDRLQTPSGKIECAPVLLLAELDRLRDTTAQAEQAAVAPAGKEASLRLIGRREVRSNNSWMHNAPRLIKGKPRHRLLMHPDDLAARMIGDGSSVTMRSASGSLVTEVEASDEMLPGVVCLPHGYGHQYEGARLSRAVGVKGASYNDLSDPFALDAPSGNAALSGLEVWVEAAIAM